jgi:transcription-repair coupling factor (superfamily II helicase)
VLSRFRTVSEQKQVVRAARDGSVDIVIGTHRLISEDVIFKDLGLVIVDEEQRFGVAQKEKFKQRFRLVDVLTLSATPIPRTLYLSLTGARDMSLIETPPPNRFPVETIVAPYDERIIREAIEREMARSGQVYFLHNRIGTIQHVADKLRLLVPKARIDIGHGRMHEDDLEEVMARFVAGETDVLLSTTIIESGLDIPNANTILIDRADRFGLADLYQLRGRVGRAHHKAYAYLFLPRHLMTVADARKRVNAIRQYSQLGAGFKIAMRDMEIRGAGSILGTAQSGHITAVGFELYCQLLKQAVGQIKGGRDRHARLPDCRLQIDFLAWHENSADVDQVGAYIPHNYMTESRWRIEAYRRLAELRSLDEADALCQEWRDRYGPFPSAVDLLWIATEIRLRAALQNITLVETQGEKLILKQGLRGDDFVMVGGKFPRLTGRDPLSKLSEINRWIISLAKADQNPA